MALINCPECNEQISSTVSQCVHCGVKICVCPECEKVYTETPEQCAECGYIFKKSAESSEKEPPCNTIPDIKVKCRAENPLIFIFDHLGAVLSIITWIFAIFLVVKFFAFRDSVSNFNELLSVESNHDSLKTIAIFLAIFDIADSIYRDIKPTLIGCMLSSWTKIKKINLQDAIKATFSTKYKNTVEKEKKILSKDIKQAIHADFLNANYDVKNRRIVNHVINGVCITIGVVLWISFAFENLEIYKTTELLKSDLLGNEGWSVSMIKSLWKVAAAIVLSIFTFIYNKRVVGKQEKQRSEWINTVMPEHYEDYRQIAIDVEY